jgi:hypothetical protein
MKECRQHCQRTRESAANLQKTLEDAKQSNDPAKMRNAIEQAQKPLAEMQSHMDMCMNMMGMHGKGRNDAGQPGRAKEAGEAALSLFVSIELPVGRKGICVR